MKKSRVAAAVASAVLIVGTFSTAGGAHAEGSVLSQRHSPVGRLVAHGNVVSFLEAQYGDDLEGERLLGAAGPFKGKAQKREAVVSALRSHALASQANLLGRLRALEQAQRAARIRPLWIGNVVGADLRRGDIELLAALPEVARVNWNPKRDVFLGPSVTEAPRAPTYREKFAPDGPGVDEIECGVQQMRAPQVWNDLGNTGTGAVVAVIDTGVCWTHPDIANQIWVNPGEDIDHDGVVMDGSDLNGVDDDANGFVDDLVGWDFDQNDNPVREVEL